MSWLKRWLDKKLQLPMSYDVRSIRKDPACKEPMCTLRGVRKDMRMGKLFGGGRVYCSCAIIESDEKDRLNRYRRLLRLKELR